MVKKFIFDVEELFYPEMSVQGYVVRGDSREVLREFPNQSVQLVFTSPPYFNARPEYAEYENYDEYLTLLEEVFAGCYNVLEDGRFLVVNVSPVLVPRPSRDKPSKRLPIPFDLHGILDGMGFEFIDDIIWRKPDAAGWTSGRVRGFDVCRQPLQYKPNLVTEYLLVYRKGDDRLIDWHIRNQDKRTLEESLVTGEYYMTNVWDISTARHKVHPAVFPDKLAASVISYYSFKYECVLDPFAGIGTTGRMAYDSGRKFILVEKEERYYNEIVNEFSQPDLFDYKNKKVYYTDWADEGGT